MSHLFMYFDNCCFSPFRVLQYNIKYWVAYKPQNLISYNSGS